MCLEVRTRGKDQWVIKIITVLEPCMAQNSSPSLAQACGVQALAQPQPDIDNYITLSSLSLSDPHKTHTTLRDTFVIGLKHNYQCHRQSCPQILIPTFHYREA